MAGLRWADGMRPSSSRAAAGSFCSKANSAYIERLGTLGILGQAAVQGLAGGLGLALTQLQTGQGEQGPDVVRIGAPGVFQGATGALEIATAFGPAGFLQRLGGL